MYLDLHQTAVHTQRAGGKLENLGAGMFQWLHTLVPDAQYDSSPLKPTPGSLVTLDHSCGDRVFEEGSAAHLSVCHPAAVGSVGRECHRGRPFSGVNITASERSLCLTETT
ncbi:hypothetical protein AOLI_G00275240 [Acnodon oligacanthus]